jgi:bifunctional UDP-N-acetylglucosamine pyrophosphorylase/glucosamine-1-phosphate N-acetyltransferase
LAVAVGADLGKVRPDVQSANATVPRETTDPMTSLAVAVLAAGRGTRMKNALPKVLHPLGGAPLIAHVLRTVAGLAPHRIVLVVAADGDAVTAAARRVVPEVRVAIQDPPLGTGHAVLQALPELPAEGTLLVVYGDTPLLRPETLTALAAAREREGAAVAVLGISPEDRTGYGRLRLDRAGRLVAIVEERHADAELLRDAPCNSGVMALDLAVAGELLAALPLRPEKGEYYLTDIVALARRRGLVCTWLPGAAEEGIGVNSQAELAALEARFQARARARALDAGVVLTSPETVHFAFDTDLAPGVQVEPYVVFGPGVRAEAGAVVRSFSHLEGVHLAAGAVVGPFARLRPGTRVGEGARIGNFVEVKNTVLGPGAKANHLTYLGDAEVGPGANIGAGTITCNYDGFGKYRTRIGEGAFIGSNTALVAPVEIGDGAIVGAGSTVTTDVPGQAVVVARARERILEDRARELRERFRRRKEQGSRRGGT